MIEISYFDKDGKGNEQGEAYCYQEAKSMEEGELIARELAKKGFTNIIVKNDGRDIWETYQKWLKRSMDFTNLAVEDNSSTEEEKKVLLEKQKTFALCLKKMEEMEKTWK